jgi:putative GTP pyrophosphokinase
MDKELASKIVEKYNEYLHQYELFSNGVYDYFSLTPRLNKEPLPIIHSIKRRLKDPDSLYRKLFRKDIESDPITLDNIFNKITDLAGVRILHLHRQQFIEIHKAIVQKITDGDWVYFEAPCAYTWDPELKSFYDELDLYAEIRDTYYTSVHYIIMPKENSPFKCELQVRTLFEEIWGEMDHYINYPDKTKSIACKEQLRVMSKLSVTGTRLADAIFNSHEEFEKLTKHSKIN